MTEMPDAYQVVFAIPTLNDRFERWLAENGLELFLLPVDDPDDLPTYGVRPSAELLAALERREVE